MLPATSLELTPALVRTMTMLPPRAAVLLTVSVPTAAMPGLIVEPGALVMLPLMEPMPRSEEHTPELQSPCNIVCRLLLEKRKIHASFDLLTRITPLLALVITVPSST